MGRELEIGTARLLLRSFRRTDVDDALAYRDDPEFARFLPHVPQPFTRADAEAFVAVNMTEPWETLPTFAIVLDDRVVGTVNFDIDPAARSAMLGYAIARAHWGRGIAVEAATAALEWAFTEHDLTEIWASTNVDHVRSRRVLEKLGMTFQTRRRARSCLSAVPLGTDHAWTARASRSVYSGCRWRIPRSERSHVASHRSTINAAFLPTGISRKIRRGSSAASGVVSVTRRS